MREHDRQKFIATCGCATPVDEQLGLPKTVLSCAILRVSAALRHTCVRLGDSLFLFPQAAVAADEM
jgi:hypothetical protein